MTSALKLAVVAAFLSGGLWGKSTVAYAGDATPKKILRFIVGNDFPPFNYKNEQGNMAGFHLALAEALCQTLQKTCDVQAYAWDEILGRFKKGQGDAVMAGLAVRPEFLEMFDFTEVYLRLPARFVALRGRLNKPMSLAQVKGKKVGVMANSVHEAYLAHFFKGVTLVSFGKEKSMRAALMAGQIDYMFDDSVRTMFWLNGKASKNCCEQKGDAYWDQTYFGPGMAIAVGKDNYKLLAQLNGALRRLRRSGKFGQILLRYFPQKVY